MDEKESLVRSIPEIVSGKGKSMLYIGASIVRMAMYDDFVSFGYDIDILEIFPGNVEYLKEKVSKSVIWGDVRNINATVSKHYDVIVWWHGPEHIYKDFLGIVLGNIENLTKLVILGCPSDFDSPDPLQGEFYGNVYETHMWKPQKTDFEALGYSTQIIKRGAACDHITAWKFTNGT